MLLLERITQASGSSVVVALVAEDDPYCSDVIVMQLERAGCASVEAFENGELLLARFKSMAAAAAAAASGKEGGGGAGGREAPPQLLVFLDSHMPVMSGYQCAEALRSFEDAEGLRPAFLVGCSAGPLAPFF